jgi:transitional endoplasmic reticulum ATPase
MGLRVKPRKRKDEGSGLAAIDRESMRELGVSSGEFVAIEGHDGRAVARVWPGRSEDSGRGIVRIDGQLRDAAGTRVHGTVEVESPERIAVALPEGLRIRGDVGSYLREELADRAVSAGDTVPLEVGFGLLSGRSGQRVPVAVVDTDPPGTVVVGNATTVDVVDRGEEIPSTAGEDGEPTSSSTDASGSKRR